MYFCKWVVKKFQKQHKPAMHVSTKDEHLIYQAQVAQKTVNLKPKFDIFLTSNMVINLWEYNPIR